MENAVNSLSRCIKSNIRTYYVLTSNSASAHFIKITTHSSSKDALGNGINKLLEKLPFKLYYFNLSA